MTAPGNEAPYGRMLTAMATAFDADGGVDLDGTARIAVHLVDHGNDGVVVSGTTGESPTTSVAEDGEILRAVIDAVGDRASVIAGVGTNSTAHSVELARQAEKLGADAMLLVTPYYNKPGPAGILRHFTEVAQSAALPVMLYDVPGRTGQAISMETYRAASELDNVTTIKHATADPLACLELTAMGYQVYSGDDALTLGYLAHGGCGLISVAGHAAGVQLRAIIDDFLNGDHAAALTGFTAVMPVIQAIMGTSNYGATTAKAALQLLGVLDNRRVRGPLVELDETEYAALEAALASAELI